MKKFRKSQSGFTALEFILVLVFFAAVGAVGYYVANSNNRGQASAQTPISLVNRWGSYIGAAATDTQSTPVGVPGLTNIVSVQASNSSGYALQCVGGASACATDGIVWAWGDNTVGQLGNGTRNGSLTPVKVQIPTPAGVGIVAIGEAKNEGYAIDSNGQAYAWGNNGTGSLCIGTKHAVLTPVAITSVTHATAVQGGQNHVIFLLSNGTLVGCGTGSKGQLGTGTKNSSSTPVVVPGLKNIVQISAGNLTSAALDSAGNVWTWGYNNHGQAGNGTIGGSVLSPIKVNLPAPAKQVYAGGDVPNNGQDIALLTNGAVYSWGANNNGQLGNGNKVQTGTPVLVKVPAGSVPIQVATGGQISYVLDSAGNLWEWGTSSSLSPVKIDSNVTLISSTAKSSVDKH